MTFSTSASFKICLVEQNPSLWLLCATEVLFVALNIPGQIKFYLVFSFSNFIPGCSDNISVFFSCYPFLLLPSVCCPLYVQVWLGAPCSSLQTFWPFCLTSHAVRWNSLESGGDDPSLLTSKCWR